MTRSLILFISLYVHVLCTGQTMRGNYDLTKFPEVSFVWNEYNPEVKDSMQFGLSYNNDQIPFQLQHSSPIDTIYKAKTILFLWEDLNHSQHGGQSEFTRKVLSAFFKKTNLTKDDKFNIGVFDRKGGNDLGSSIHTMLSDNFTSDHKQLAEAVVNFKPKYDFFSKQVNSELYMAIEEGIDILQKEPSDRTRAIVVFTAGSNQDSYGGRNSIDENRALALKIPIYVVKYPIKGCEHCSNIDVISQKTYGLTIENEDASIASNLLGTCYKKMNDRHYGQDYRISFHTIIPRDGSQHTFLLSVEGKEYSLSFVAPTFSLKVWVKRNILFSIFIIITLFLIIALIVFLVYKIRKKRHLEILNLQSEQQIIQEKANSNWQSLEDYRRQTVEKERGEKEVQQLKLMQDKNLYARLKYSIDGKEKFFSVTKAEITIGRDEDNDLILFSDSVSRHHAKLSFNNMDFEIKDLGSTNKVIVNGDFVKQKSLTNGDIIGLGEVVIYFYI